MDCSPPGSSVHGILQARIWSGLPFPSPGDLPNPGIEPKSPALKANSLPSEPPDSKYFWHASLFESYKYFSLLVKLVGEISQVPTINKVWGPGTLWPWHNSNFLRPGLLISENEFISCLPLWSLWVSLPSSAICLPQTGQGRNCSSLSSPVLRACWVERTTESIES